VQHTRQALVATACCVSTFAVPATSVERRAVKPPGPMPQRAEILARRRVLRQRVRARQEVRLFMRRLGILLSALVALILAGTVGFAVIEGTSLAYGLIWTLDTITTVGSISEPHDAGGRVLKVAVELLGIATLFYALATIAEFFVSGQLSGLVEERRLQKMIDSYADHYIVCGFGRVGRQVARDLLAAGRTPVVVDDNFDNRETARELGVPYIEAEPAHDEVLKQAGIDSAKAVIACVDSDAENIFITLTARGLRPDILIVARASAEDTEQKLVRAGADRVISPYKTSGTEMARIALHPQIGGAVEAADYRIEEIRVAPASRVAGRRIKDVRGQAAIVALRHQRGQLEAQPSPDAVIQPGDTLVALGPPGALERLEALLEPASPGRRESDAPGP
jgi:voltage-gated potassium channel